MVLNNFSLPLPILKYFFSIRAFYYKVLFLHKTANEKLSISSDYSEQREEKNLAFCKSNLFAYAYR